MIWAAMTALAIATEAASVPPPKPIEPLPSARQLAWHDLEYYAFVHFNMNTFTDREWGDGTESPALFNPTELDCRQWARIFRDAGMKGVIITAKHHDGFCLWPSAHTEHSVKNSPWRDGKGDLVRELSDACREFGLKFGVYLSPWDRNCAHYGDSPRYNEHFRNQLREVLTNYGEVFEVWFDGACGEGPNGKRQEYDWPSFIQVVRECQPNAVIFSDAGPDVRWVGNESGFAGETNWAFIPRDELYPGIPGKTDLLNTGDIHGTHWVPAECDVSIRPGWYYHASQDDQVKSLEQLLDIWHKSVGRGANLLLNIPVDRRGLVHENDADRLLELRRAIDGTFRSNLKCPAKARSATVRGDDSAYAASNVLDSDPNTYWATDDPLAAVAGASGEGDARSILIDLGSIRAVTHVVLSEHLPLGQRVKSFTVLARDDENQWHAVAAGSTIGSKRILQMPVIFTDLIEVRIDDCRGAPAIESIEVFAAPFDANDVEDGGEE